MYPVFLTLHSLVRWVVVVCAIAAVARAFAGWLGKKEWTALDNRLGLFFSTSLDVQFLLGLILYLFLSPITTAAFRDFGVAMSNDVMRFFTVEHVVYIVVAVALAHAGQALSKKATGATAQHRMAAILFGISVLVILFAIPWPFTAEGAGRPWIRLG